MNMPKVIVTDRNMSLMKAIGNVVPESYAMNSYFHVQANVKQRCILDCKYPLGKKGWERGETSRCCQEDNEGMESYG